LVLYLSLILIKKDLWMLNKLKSLKVFQSNTSFMQLIRTYIVGAMNLIIGLTLTYLFQFFVLTFIEFPLRTYVTNVFAFLIGVVISYYLSKDDRAVFLKILQLLSLILWLLVEFLNDQSLLPYIFLFQI